MKPRCPIFVAVGEGGAYPQNGFQEGYAQVIEPDTWKNQFEVTMEMAEDAAHGQGETACRGVYAFLQPYA